MFDSLPPQPSEMGELDDASLIAAVEGWARAAEVAAALNIGHGRASGEIDLAVMLRDRFPKVGAMFLAGAVDARRVEVIAFPQRRSTEDWKAANTTPCWPMIDAASGISI